MNFYVLFSEDYANLKVKPLLHVCFEIGARNPQWDENLVDQRY